MADVEAKDVVAVMEETNQSLNEAAEIMPHEDACMPLPEDVSKTGKKRLREVSVEVGSPKDTKTDADIESKETDGPPKRNRLKTTEDNGENGEAARPTTPPSTSPVLSTSPPHDSKVRQIRRRVKDLSWKDGRRKADGTAEPVRDVTDAQEDGPETAEVGSDGKPDEDDSSQSVSAKSDSDKDEIGSKRDSASQAKAAFGSDMDAELQPSSGAASGRLSPETGNCQGKRRRDDTDQNPRETKRITPPPEKEKEGVKEVKETPQPVPAAKPSGFLAFAGSASPFAAASGPNLFGGGASKPTFGAHTTPQAPLSPAFVSPSTAKPSTSTTSAAPAFGGFGKYASAASPFATVKASGASPFGTPLASTSKSTGSKSPTRSKSPGRQHVNAFEPYTKSSGKFSAVPTRPSKKQRRATADKGELGTGSGSASENAEEDAEEEYQEKPASFSDILSAKDTNTAYVEDETKVKLTEQEVTTGEEEEDTEFQVRSKVFTLVQGSWQERGAGILRLNIHRETGRPRLLHRTDGVLRLVLNTGFFPGMDFKLGADPRYVRFVMFGEDAKPVSWMLRFANTKHADEFLSHVKPHVPSGKVPRADENV